MDYKKNLKRTTKEILIFTLFIVATAGLTKAIAANLNPDMSSFKNGQLITSQTINQMKVDWENIEGRPNFDITPLIPKSYNCGLDREATILSNLTYYKVGNKYHKVEVWTTGHAWHPQAPGDPYSCFIGYDRALGRRVCANSYKYYDYREGGGDCGAKGIEIW